MAVFDKDFKRGIKKFIFGILLFLCIVFLIMIYLILIGSSLRDIVLKVTKWGLIILAVGIVLSFLGYKVIKEIKELGRA